MKKKTIISIFALSAMLFTCLQAQVIKSLSVSTPGTLTTQLTTDELNTVTNLTLSGSIDARDFKTMRDNMPALSVLDMTGINIIAFTGTGGTFLQSPSMPYLVNSIPYDAFNGKTTLNTVILSQSMTSIKSGAFSGSAGSISIPSNSMSYGIDAGAFSNFNGSINVSSANPTYSSVEGVLFNKDKTTILQCPISKNGTYTIPSTVTTIENNAFGGCIGLTSIIIPSSVTKIFGSAFYNCSSLSSINIPSSVNKIEAYAFQNCTGLSSITANAINATNGWEITLDVNVFYNVNKSTCTLYVPKGSKGSYQGANQWQDFTNIVEMTTAVPTVTNESISIYPNPINDGFQIKGIEGTSEIRLTDLNGKVLLQKQVIGNENVSVSEFPAGMYMINLSNNGVSYQKKLIKM